MSYSVAAYNDMIADHVRTEAYTRAMEAVVKPGSVVLDVGTGSGYFAVLACKLGAAKVYAIEPNPIIEVARQVARDNGFGEKIEFIQRPSSEVSLPARVDVIVSDLHGSIPFFGKMIETMVDLRQRFLKPGGILLPSSDELFAALVSSPKLEEATTEATGGGTDSPSMAALRPALRNRHVSMRIEPNECVSEPRLLGTLDYTSVEQGRFSAAVSWPTTDAIRVNGVCVWFDSKIHGSIGFSNSPSSPRTVYGRSVFPLLDPIDLQPGDVTKFELDAVPHGDDYLFRWSTSVTADGDASPKICLEQSTFDARVVPLERLKARRSDFVPAPSDKRRHSAFVLDRVDGARTLEDIARVLSAEHAQEFPTWQAALTFVADTVEANS